MTVLNLSTGKEMIYSGISPRRAVICAFAQERGDWNTWDYETRYGDRVEVGRQTVACGDFACLKGDDE